MKKHSNVQLVHKKKTTSYITLPTKLVDDFKELKLSKINTAYCLKFVGIIARNNFFEYNDIFSSTPIPTEYIKEAFNSIHYMNWLRPLITNNIVIRNDYYSKDSNICYNYSINNIYSLPLVLCDTNTSNTLQTVTYQDIIKLHLSDKRYLNWFTDDMDSLNIDYIKLQDIINEKVNNIKIDDYAINEDILDRNVLLTANGNSFYMKRESAIEKAKQLGLVLIKDEKRFVMDTKEDFINKKKLSIYTAYTDALVNIEKGNYRAKRNTTNNRLDTNITNLCSQLTNEICFQNELTQIDLNNSQFSLLSHILTSELDTPDFKAFKELSVSGELYTYIKENLALNTRKEGKQAMFEILFSGRNNNTTNKAKLKVLFPSVIKWIDTYKAANGDNAFCIMLQKFESNLFIDNILVNIKKNKYFCMTKHDSFIIKEKDYNEIIKIIVDEFNKINLKANLDTIKTSVFREDNLLIVSQDLKEEIVSEIDSNEVIKVNDRELKNIFKIKMDNNEINMEDRLNIQSFIWGIDKINNELINKYI